MNLPINASTESTLLQVRDLLTDVTVTPIIDSITFNYVQEGIYQQVTTGRGMEWEVYGISETRTAFLKKIDNGPKQTILHVLPL